MANYSETIDFRNFSQKPHLNITITHRQKEAENEASRNIAWLIWQLAGLFFSSSLISSWLQKSSIPLAKAVVWGPIFVWILVILADFRSGKALAYFDRLFTSSDDFGNHDSAGIMAIDPRAIEQVIPSESDAASWLVVSLDAMGVIAHWHLRLQNWPEIYTTVSTAATTKWLGRPATSH